MSEPAETDWKGPAALIGVLAVLRFALAAGWDLIADEAWYWVWSHHLAAGYYDQPPGIAWLLAVTRAAFGDGEWAIRLVPVACGAMVGLVLLPAARDRWAWAAWCAVLPPIAWLTVFATPDAPLLACWAIALAAAIRGGPGWLLAGVAAGLAFEFKHTGALVLPLLFLGARADLRERWPWLGAVAALVIAAPNLLWNAQNNWLTVGFQAREGLLHASPPGPVGGLLQVVEQLGVATPMLGLVGFVWCIWRGLNLSESARAVQLAWWTSAPVLVFFALAGMAAPADAHWPAPAWIGVGLGLSYETGRWSRATWLGVGLGGAMVLVLAVHTVRPVFSIPADPAARLTEGSRLGRTIAAIAAPEPGLAGPIVVTERYQEAAFIQYYAGIDARVAPGCGRPGQQDLWTPHPIEGHALFVRPSTGGPPTCIESAWSVVRGPVPIEASDTRNRRLGPWQVFELQPR